jgi:nickel-type superoxide dismutase maturation protease
VTWHPQRSKLRLIKRLKSVEGTGLCLLGDNPTESTDSRQLGAVPTNLLIGEVVARLPRGESEQGR